ncbi:MAG: hypothetical protein V2J24_15740 [Pseudomonadales bacterium]|jgi:hypothetical protein|nr:hypothetical protein [Pseudomonadales bacterium]
MDAEQTQGQAEAPKQRAAPKLNVQVNWRAVFAESIFISASILLAFALQDWDEASDIEERTRIALCNVRSELQFNRTLIEKDFMPRQQGMLALARASISLLQSDSEAEIKREDLDQIKSDLSRIMLQESLRRSAWSLASESGYLLHANFQLATEIGALLDYQEDRYQSLVELVYDSVYEHNSPGDESPVDYYLTIADLVTEWIGQTRYLQQRYEALFSREDFASLECQR